MSDEVPDRFKQAMEMHKEAGVNWRYWGDVRFKQLTLFLSLTGALVVGVLHEKIRGTPMEPTMAAIGILLACLFFVLEERATYYRRRFVAVAKHVERHAGAIPIYHLTRNQACMSSDRIYRVFFVAVVGLWVSDLDLYLHGQEAGLAAGVVGGLVAFAAFFCYGSRLQSRPVNRLACKMLAKHALKSFPQGQHNAISELNEQESEHCSGRAADESNGKPPA